MTDKNPSDKESEKEIEELIRQTKLKFDHYVSFVWFLLFIFLTVGFFTSQRERAFLGVIVLVIMRVLNEILQKGIESTKFLFYSKQVDDDPPKKD